jgi:hypothetical protein
MVLNPATSKMQTANLPAPALVFALHRAGDVFHCILEAAPDADCEPRSA